MYNMQPYAITDIGHYRPSVVFIAICIVLIQLLAAKPNKSINQNSIKSPDETQDRQSLV